MVDTFFARAGAGAQRRARRAMAVEVARQTAISARLHRQGTAATGVSAAVWTGDTLKRPQVVGCPRTGPIGV